MSPVAAHRLRWVLRPLIAAVMIPVGVFVGVCGLVEYWVRHGGRAR